MKKTAAPATPAKIAAFRGVRNFDMLAISWPPTTCPGVLGEVVQMIGDVCLEVQFVVDPKEKQSFPQPFQCTVQPLCKLRHRCQDWR